MRNWTTNEVRKVFLDYFEERCDHHIHPSASLVPVNDDTLLWINSGVSTLKKYFDGSITPPKPRISNSQKCIRTNDIENVGVTARHHTLFEMLGNFSIGDYFKEGSIEMAWTLLTDEKYFGLDGEKLSVTVHPDDQEAIDIWTKYIPLERIYKEPANFWEIGAGPCGPNTEIFYDRGEKYELDAPKEELYVGGENERWLEVWNIVFSQYNNDGNGNYTELPRKNIDTGMGLERLTSLLTNVPTNFDIDIFQALIKETEKYTKYNYDVDAYFDLASPNHYTNTQFKIIADHLRAVVFAIADGALPSNEGRGYIIRRLIRRALVAAHKLEIKEDILNILVPVMIKTMEEFYPYLAEKQEFVNKVVATEEASFAKLLHGGLAKLAEIKAKTNVITGEEAFLLFDTHGFPFELTKEFADENKMTVEEEDFYIALEAQRELARANASFKGDMEQQREVLFDIKHESTFVGYDATSTTSKVIAIIDGESLVDSAANKTVEIITDASPFYATSGGQEFDHGMINDSKVIDVKKGPNKEIIHTVEVTSTISVGDEVSLNVDNGYRAAVARNHSATHLMLFALRNVFGPETRQAGSRQDAKETRFDFTLFGKLDDQNIMEVERVVNSYIAEAHEIVTTVEDYSDELKDRVTAQFDEKYEDKVRVVTMGGTSIELCGGTHVANTSVIEKFAITNYESKGSGVYRVTAITGAENVDAYFTNMNNGLVAEINKINATLNITEDVNFTADRAGFVAAYTMLAAKKDELVKFNKANEKANMQAAVSQYSSLAEQAEEVNGVKFLTHNLENVEPKAMREIIDNIKNEMVSGVLVLTTTFDGKTTAFAGVTKDLTSTYAARDLLKVILDATNSRGGGNLELAQAGINEVEKLEEALATIKGSL